MILIYGGAYQGKTEYAKREYGLREEEIFSCTDGADFWEAGGDGVGAHREKAGGFCDEDGLHRIKAIDDINGFVYYCLKKGIEPKTCLEERRGLWEDKIIIATDVSQGIVPVDKDQRAFREMMGRTLLYLSGEAERVVRIFCGLPQVLK